ncbi:MAG TPA: 5'-nucleotidase C-terminal domain-containing protein [Ardenticatenaceae bacterium]
MERKHNSILTAVLIPLFALALMLGLSRYVGTAQAQSAEEAAAPAGGGVVTLTLLHTNDGESSLLPFTYNVPPNSGYSNATTVTLPVGSIAAFKSVTLREMNQAHGAGHAVVNVYAGDLYLPSAVLACSLPPAPPETPIYDAVALRQIPFDALTIGNHEFDYGPEFFERFVRQFEYDTDNNGTTEWTHAFLSSNLDFSGEPDFDDLTDDDGVIVGTTSNGSVIAHSLIMTDAGQMFGVVGASPPDLPTISSPGNVVVTTDNLTETAQVVQAEVDRLYDEYGVRKIIFASQLQNINADMELIPMLSRVDVAIAGGGNEFLLNPAVPDTQEKLPGERATQFGEYPIRVTDATSRTVYLVTTAGNYKYLGRLDVAFDAEGEITEFNTDTSYLRRVIPESEQATEVGVQDAVTPDPMMVQTVTEPVESCLEDFANTPIARTEVLLDVSRTTVRSRESNAGNLIADSFLYSYQQYSDTVTNTMQLAGATNPVIAVQNGGGIRQNAGDQLPVNGQVPGNIRRLDTLNVLPFANFVAVVQDVTPVDLEAILERAASGLPGQGGQFLQIAGFRVTYDPSQPAQELDVEGNVLVQGNRVFSATLEDGTPIIENYEVVANAPLVDLVTNHFTARGGDNYPWLASNTNQSNLIDETGIQISYEQSLIEYLQTFPVEGDPALPTIQAEDERYQPGGEGRITITDAPTAVTLNNVGAMPGSTLPVWLLAGAGLALSLGTMAALHRRRR